MKVDFVKIALLLRRYLEFDPSTGVETVHTRSDSRGGLLRLTLEEGCFVVIKVWHIRNTKERLKSVTRLSNGWREWRMHRLIYQSGIQVPEPLFFYRLTMASGAKYEIMVIEDLGDTEQGLPYLKSLIQAGDEPRIATFEDQLLNITEEFFKLTIVDVDHQLNNFVVDSLGRLMRIDFECARHRWFGGHSKQEVTEMIARLLASHIYAVQPEIGRSERFAEQLYKRLDIDYRVRGFVQASVNKKLENQHRRTGFTTVVNLPR